MIRKSLVLALCLLTAAFSAHAVEFTDACGRIVSVDSPQRVAALYTSYADAWQIAGGTLLGAPQDFADRCGGAEVQDLGTTKTPNTELLLALDPDFVILSKDIASHADVAALLDEAGIPCALFSTKDYREYMEQIRLFCELTGRPECLEAQIANVQEPIEAMIADARADDSYGARTALLLRASSMNVHAKGSRDTVAGVILSDMGFVNIADDDRALGENLSLEVILTADPDYIFVVTMGASSEDALQSVAEILTDNPAWAGLSAVQNGRYVVLDSDLFHYHPNARWAQSYAFIRNLLAEEAQ